VLGPDHKTRFTKYNDEIGAAGWGSPVRVFNTMPGVKGHEYRVVATATLLEPNGYAGCSQKGKFGCYQTVVVTATGTRVVAS
jgi:hypothetical protein